MRYLPRRHHGVHSVLRSGSSRLLDQRPIGSVGRVYRIGHLGTQAPSTPEGLRLCGQDFPAAPNPSTFPLNKRPRSTSSSTSKPRRRSGWRFHRRCCWERISS